MKLQLSFVFIFLLFQAIGFTQNKGTYYPTPTHPELFKYVPLVDENTPDWARLMYADSVNVYEVDRQYSSYYEVYDFQKNIHTQNYKHWRRLIQQQHYLQADGTIYIPTEKEQQEVLKLPQSVANSQKFTGQLGATGSL